MKQQSLGEYLRHGQTPFFRLPVAPCRTRGDAEQSAYAGADVVLLGVPYDGAVTYQPGARLAPYHVRRVSALLSGYHATHRLDVFERVDAMDGGNVTTPPFNAGAVRELVELEVGAIIDAQAKPFVVGGDHSISLPCMRALARRHGPIAVVHVDAHFDTSDAEAWHEPYHHGTPLRHALQEGLVAPNQLYQLGMRGPWKDANEDAISREHGAFVRSMDAIMHAGISATLAEIVASVGAHPLYLTFDIDAVDPAFAPGTGTPVPGGFTSREAIALVRALAGVNLVGMDVVEVAPTLEAGDATSLLAAHLLFEGLGLVALHA